MEFIENLLGLKNLVQTKIPGKFKTTRDSWEQVFLELNMEKHFKELID